jgi:hypothetical protein
LFTWSNWRHTAIREFVRKNAPSLRQLMKTDKFLMDGARNWDVSTSGNANSWLKDLNNGSAVYKKPASVMNADGSDGKVETRLFVGNLNSLSTINWIQTRDRSKPNFSDELYEDGIPKWPMGIYALKNLGDGTVPLASARWPADAGWASLYPSQIDEEHVSLIKGYKAAIASFLLEGTAPNLAPRRAFGDPTPPAARLSFSVIGDVRLYITSPSGQSTGINPVNGNPAEDIPDSRCAFDSEGGAVGIENPASGTYQITCFGEAPRNFRLNIDYGDNEVTESYRFQGFGPSAPRTFTISVNPAGAPVITVTPPAQPPANMQANPYTSGATEKTRLTWNASAEPGLAGYNVYSVAETEPYFSKLCTVGAAITSFDTADPWCGDAAVPTITYAVAALSADGVESFFSNTDQNNDRDHDGLTDVEETAIGTDMNQADSDHDGITDGEERNRGTNPLTADTDGDGSPDLYEIQIHSDPLDAESLPPFAGDVNGDRQVGLPDVIQALQIMDRMYPQPNTSKLSADAGGDQKIGMEEAIYALQCAAGFRNNHAPQLAPIGNKDVDEGVNLTFAISATDDNGHTLTCSVATVPTGAVFDAATRTFSWTPTYAQSGTYHVIFSVWNELGELASETVTITVGDATP